MANPPAGMSLDALNYLKSLPPAQQEAAIASWGGSADTANEWYKAAKLSHGANAAPNTQGTYQQGRDADLDKKIDTWSQNIDSRYDRGAWAAWSQFEDPSCPPSHPFRPDPAHMRGMGVDPNAASQHCVEKPVDVPHALKGTGHDANQFGQGGGQNGQPGMSPLDPRGQALAELTSDPLQQALVNMGIRQGGTFGEADMDPNAAGRQGFEKMFSLAGGGIFMQGSGEPVPGQFVSTNTPKQMATPSPKPRAGVPGAPAPAAPTPVAPAAQPMGTPQKPKIPAYKPEQVHPYDANSWWRNR